MGRNDSWCGSATEFLKELDLKSPNYTIRGRMCTVGPLVRKRCPIGSKTIVKGGTEADWSVSG